MLDQFLSGFVACFARPAERQLLLVDVHGLPSGVQCRNAEAIALNQKVATRTRQRFLESIVWDEEQLLDRWQKIVADEIYGRDGLFLNGLNGRQEVSVIIIPRRARLAEEAESAENAA